MSAMQYYVKQGEQNFQVKIEDQDDGGLRAWIDDQEHRVDVQNLPGGMLSMLIDGVSYDVDFEQARSNNDLETALNVLVHHSVVPLTVMDERRHRLQDLAGSSAAGQASGEILSPMPGKLIKFLVEPGQQVKAGQGLVVVEAMKMENEIASPMDGIVAGFKAEAGTAIEAGSVLMKVEPNKKDQ